MCYLQQHSCNFMRRKVSDIGFNLLTLRTDALGNPASCTQIARQIECSSGTYYIQLGYIVFAIDF